MQKWIIALLIFSWVILENCTSHREGINMGIEPHEKLSSYGFFSGNLSDLNPSDDVIPYDLSSTLFSDYSHKSRFVWMPEGSAAKYSIDHVLDFPIGSVLIKNFYYLKDERDASLGRRIMETRLLVNSGEEWSAYDYIWNDDQTEAYYDVVGDIKEVTWINKVGKEMKVDYIIPNKNQCKGCHAYDNKLKPIGPKARNINKDFAYHDGIANQLMKWQSIGYLEEIPSVSEIPKVAVWNDESDSLHSRALAYLDINCGHCHNPKGAANTSGLTLMADSPLGRPLGVYKATVSAGAGTGGHTYSIVPGHPEKSIMIYRMNSDNPGAMMPELGRRLIHNEGVDLISQWIEQMEYGRGGQYSDLL